MPRAPRRQLCPAAGGPPSGSPRAWAAGNPHLTPRLIGESVRIRGVFETPLTILSEDALDAIHDQAMTILEEVGAEVVHEPACAMLAGLGQKVDGTRVYFDREFVMAQLRLAPERVTVHGRNPERAVTFGGGALCMLPPGGSPFVADRERGRRDGMYVDHVEIG